MRTLRIGLVAALLAGGVALLGAAPASGGPDTNILNVDKVIVGDAPAGDFLVNIDCNQMVNDLVFASAALGPQQLFPPPGTTCVASEVDDLGADDVTITCTVIANPQNQTFCDNDTTARFADTNQGEITFTVTNTFVEPPPPDVAPAAAAPEVVAATPTFTG